MILSSIFFLLIFIAILYNLIIPSFCNNITICRIWDEPTSTAYQIFTAGTVIIMLILNIFQALNCPSLNTSNNILLAAASTFACWVIFIFVVYMREYFRMSFANVFGYIAMSTTIGNLLPLIVNPNVVETGILQNAIQLVKNENETSTSTISQEELGKLLTNEMIKIPIRDNFQLLSYIRSGTNFIYSLMFIRNHTNVYFKPNIQETLEQIKPLIQQLSDNNTATNSDQNENSTSTSTSSRALTLEEQEKIFKNIGNIISENKILSELLTAIYYRDIIGEIILFVLAGVMCIYLSNYLITKINCNYKTKQQIEQSIDEYNTAYNQAQEKQNNTIVVSQ